MFYAVALESFEKKRYDASVFNASQAIILANDAFCIVFLGKRASKDHREAVQLHVQASAGGGNKKDIVSDALEMRGEFGYTEKTSDERGANLFLVRAKRFLDWVKGRIGYE
jgi:HEPN domain-containing protein